MTQFSGEPISYEEAAKLVPKTNRGMMLHILADMRASGSWHEPTLRRVTEFVERLEDK